MTESINNNKTTLVVSETSNQNTIHYNHQKALVNVSKMAKAFNQTPAAWLRLSSAKRFLNELSHVKNIPLINLIKIVKKTEPDYEKGVWMHEDVALEFARWLSPSFAIWNNQRTQELLLTGKTEMQPQEELLSVVASGIYSQVEWIDEAMHEQMRKAEYHDAILQSKTLIPTTLIAKELGMSAIALNKWLHDKKIIYKTDTHWVLYSDYQGKGYTGTKTALYLDSAGKYQSNIHTYWTEKGREFIHAMLKEIKQIA